MAAPKESEFHISFPLDLGIDNTASDTVVQPLGERPALVSSVNARLSKVRGIPTKAPGASAMSDPEAHSITASSASGGIVPCGHMSSSVVMRHRRYAAQRVAGSSLSALTAPLPGTAGVSNYWPADVSRAGPVPGDGHYCLPATCLHDGQIWMASVRPRDDAGGVSIFVTVLGADGECVAATQSVVPLAGDITSPEVPWVGLTAHGANGVKLWHRDGLNTGVKLRSLSIANGGTVTATAGSVIYTPDEAGPSLYDVTSHADDYAWLLTTSSTTVGDIVLHKVDVGTDTIVADETVSVTTTTSSSVAVKSAELSGGTMVAVMVALGSASTCTEILFDGDAMGAPIHTFTGRLNGIGRPAAGFYRVGSTEYVCYGESYGAPGSSSFGSGGGEGGTFVEMREVDATGTLAGTLVVPWVLLMSGFAHHSPSETEIYPIMLAQPSWGYAGFSLVTDPAVHVYRIDSTDTASCIARCGVDTAAIFPMVDYGVSGDVWPRRNSDAIWCDGDKILFVYAETSWRARGTQFPLRYVELDMAARQPRYAIGSDGPAIIAAAMPMEWDGVTLAECSPPHRPRVLVAVSGGSGSNIAADTYYVSAVVTWRDAAGVKHRSVPAPTRTVSAGGNPWVIQVSAHQLVHDGAVQDSYEVELYISTGGTAATTLYRQDVAPSSMTDTYWEFDDISTPTSGSSNPVIYTTGGTTDALPAQAPPCMYDVAVVQDRAWMINAERRSELWFSKPKEYSPLIGSIAYEWSSSCTVRLPTAAGKGVAVVENNGAPTILCENGVWVVTGPGPDATLTDGQIFNTPEQISDIACSSRDSVIRTPAGVMFRSNTRFAMVGPRGVRIVDEVDASSLGALVPVLLRDTQEAVWFSSTGTHHVYNYALDRWSQWNSTACPAVVGGSLDPVSGLVNLVASSGGAVMQMDPSEASSAAQMSFTTGHIVTGGPQDDTTITDVVIHAKSNGSHGLAVTLQEDYGQGDSVTRTFTASRIANCTVGGQYAVCVSPKNAAMRACKVTITETDAAGDAFRPLSVTLIGRKMPGTKRDAVRAPGRTPG